LLYIADRMTSLDRSDDNGLLVALRHPLRRRILRHMAACEVISPLELATELDVRLSNVSYHVRVLADCAAVTLVRTAPRRGSVQHFYCSTIKAPWALEILDRDGPEIESAGENPDP
jgi:DNA-binding transcriptional ArsR family regulator